MKVTDARGKVFSPFTGDKIVSLVPSLTETLFFMGLGNKIVGVTRYCIAPEEAKQKPKVGGTKSPNVKKIKDLSPDLVIANMEENPKERIEKIEEFCDVFVTFPKSFSESVRLLEDLSKLFGVEKETKIKNVIAEGKELSNKHTFEETFRVFCPIWKNPWMSVNKDTYIHDMLQQAGFENVMENREERYPIVDEESIQQMDIDVLIMPSEPYEFKQPDIEDLKRINMKLENVPVFFIDGSLLSWYGVRSIKGLKELINLRSQINKSP